MDRRGLAGSPRPLMIAGPASVRLARARSVPAEALFRARVLRRQVAFGRRRTQLPMSSNGGGQFSYARKTLGGV